MIAQNRILHFFRHFTNHFIQNFSLHNVKLNVTYKFKESSINNPNLIQQLTLILTFTGRLH